MRKTFDSRTLVQQGRINKALAERGLGQLHEEGLLDQLAMCIQGHERFRKLLASIEPEKRQNAYDCLAPRLMFKPKSLDEYMADTKMRASESLSRCEPVLVGQQPQTLEEKAEFAIGSQLAMENARGRLKVTCNACTQELWIYASDKQDAYSTLAALGWAFDGDKAWCPVCSQP